VCGVVVWLVFCFFGCFWVCVALYGGCHFGCGSLGCCDVVGSFGLGFVCGVCGALDYSFCLLIRLSHGSDLGVGVGYRLPEQWSLMSLIERVSLLEQQQLKISCCCSPDYSMHREHWKVP